VTTSAHSLRQSTTLAAALAQTCRRYPDRVAVRNHGTSMTYRDLDRRVRELAAGLSARMQRIQPDRPSQHPTVVAVQLEAGVDAVCALLAVLATGAAYLPLDPNIPDGYLIDILHVTRPAVVIGRHPQPAHAPGETDGAGHSLDAEFMAVDVAHLAAHGSGARALDGLATAPGDPAYVIFTSGSTGQPKGVLLSHAAMLHSTAARVDAYGVPGRVPLLHAASVDVYSGVLFWALLTGGTLVVGPAGLRDVAATAALIAEEQITDLVYLSSLYPLLLEHADPDRMPALRRVMIGSDRWSESVIDRHVALLPQVSLHNEYGPTETAVWTSQACVWDGRAKRRRPLTIGRPVAGTGYHLLDDQQQPVPAGERGELYITGAQLALGYLADNAEASGRFVHLPAGERAFRTGDLAETTRGGEFVFAGRVDRQIKVAGHRIEPAQIETVLMAQPTVGLAHVVARTDPVPGAVLVAYLTPRSAGRPVIVDEIRDAVAQQLPRYMMPAVCVVLDELPRTRSGKIDETALPTPTSPTTPADGADAPGDAVETALARMVGAVLNCAPPPATAPLAVVGSLALMQIAARIRREHGVVVPVSALFAEPTIRQLAAAMRTAHHTDRPPLAPTRHDPAGTPLSAQQRQVWFLTQLDPDTRAYHTQWSLHLDGPLDVAALTAALSHLVARHEILRTTVHTTSAGEPIQIVHPPWQVPLPVHDLSALPDPDRSAALDHGIAEQAATMFDTATLPLVRWTLYRLGEQEWTLVVVEHHYVHDGWSAVLLLDEIRNAYAAITAGRPLELPELPVQYRDWAAWQRTWLDSADGARQRDYWQRQLAGVDPHGVTFTPDCPRPARQTFHGSRVDVTVDVSVVDALDVVCAGRGVTRFGVFLSAFVLLVRQHTGAGEVVIGSALANRLHPEVEPLLGMFVNALPLRLPVRPDDTVNQVVARVMAVLLAAQDHQEYPLVEIVKSLGMARDPARNPLFQLMFAFHDTPRTAFQAAGVTGQVRIEHNGSAKNDVNVVCMPHPPTAGSSRSHNGITILWEYNRDLFTPATAHGLLDGFVRILTRLTDPRAWQRSATALDVVDPEQAALVTRLATGPMLSPTHARLQDGVTEQIRTQPTAVAVAQGDRTLTYAELDSTAAAIQAQLTAVGVAPGDRVALACGPGADHVAACVAVLRLGAAYVCLDPHDPPSRVDTILADSRPAAVVCSPHLAATISTAAAGIPQVVTEDPPAAPTPDVRPASTGGGDAAYLVYTSGATGTPKAVVATHTNAVTGLTARTAYTTAHTGLGDGRAVRTLIVLPLQFDVATSMIFWTLWTGGTVVFPDHRDDPRDPSIVRRLIDRHAVTHVNLVASFYLHFLAALTPDWDSPLTTVAIGGEPCPTEVVREHARLLPTVALDNEYGPTEATVWCTAARVHDPHHPVDPDRVTVGRPLPNYAVHILTEHLDLLPVGARGELCVAGPGVTPGYLNQPHLTAERFITPTSGPLAGIRLYRTGDHGRRTPTGEIELLGRTDDQVQIRGHRVELGEIVHRLHAHPAVAAAHVLAEHTPDAPTRLVAYVAVPDAPPGLPDAVRAWARTQLPAAMVPAVVVVLDALPLTAAGKIDRNALPRPDTPVVEGGEHTADDAVTPVQKAVLAVWRDLLGHDRVGLDQDWFALGGDSLTAIRAALRLQSHGIAVSVAQLLNAGTIRALTDHLPDHPTTGASAVVRRPGGTEVPLTAMQAWFFAQDFAAPHHFTQARLLAIPADADPATIRRAVVAVVDRHDAFRTRFIQHDSGWTARLLDHAPTAALAEYQVPPGAPAPTPEALTAVHHGLNITSGPLWRAALFTDPAGGRRWLYLVAHHLIVDAVSWDILIHDLTLAHTQPALLTATAAPGITTPPDQPQGDDAQYWKQLAATVPPAADTPSRPRAAYGQLEHRDVELAARTTRHLITLTHRRQLTIPAVLLAALHHALAPQTRDSGLYTYVEGHGRDDLAAAGQIVGWLTSLFPILLTPDAATGTNLLAIAAAFQDQLAAAPRGGTGFGAARYLAPHSALGARLTAIALPEVTVNYLGHHPATPHRPIHVVPHPAGQAIGATNVLPTALHLTAVIDRDVLRLHLSADPGRFTAARLATVCESMRDALDLLAGVEPLTDTPAPGARPLFLVHPVDGDTHWYRPLAQALGSGWGCYGLRANNPPGPQASLSTMATRYLAQVHRVQPTGPYTLLGWSFGAAVALDMALQLEADGERVDRLVLLDPPPLPTGRGIDVAVLTAHLAMLLPDLPDERVTTVAALAAVAAPAERLAVLTDQLAPIDDPGVLDRIEVLLQHHQALAGWTPAGTVTHLLLVESGATAHQVREWLSHARTGQHHVVHVDDHDHRALLRDPAALAHLVAVLTDATPAA
jgi:amino acid adenylation domain-containing protein